MMMYVVATVVCVIACTTVMCARGLIARGMQRYGRIKAAFHVGRTGFYIEADDGPGSEARRGLTRRT